MRTLTLPSEPSERQRRRFEALGRVGFASETAGVREMLAVVVDEVTPMSGVDGGLSVVLWNPEDGTFETSASTVPGQERELAARRVRRSQGASRWIVDHDEGLLVADIDDDPFGANEMLREFGMHTYLGLPIPGPNGPVGVLYAMRREPDTFDAEDVEFLSVVASRASGAIRTGWERDRVLGLLDRTRAMHGVAAVLNQADSLTTRLDRVAQIVLDGLRAQTISLVPSPASVDVLPRSAVAGPALRLDPQPSLEAITDALESDGGLHSVQLPGTPPQGWLVATGVRVDRRDAERVLQATAEQVVASFERQRALEALHETNAALQDFAHAVSHDLKTPLASIIGFSELLGSQLPEDSGRAAEFLSRIDQGARRMSTLIDSVLEHAAHRGREMVLEPVALGSVVATVLDALHAQAITTDATIDVEVDDTVTGQRAALELVVQNLIANALKYTRDGLAPRVRIRSAQVAGVVTLTIADEGPGVPEDAREAVFRLFERGDQRDKPGLGIGLATVRALTVRMGGTVHLAANHPVGTRAIVTLPAAE